MALAVFRVRQVSHLIDLQGMGPGLCIFQTLAGQFGRLGTVLWYVDCSMPSTLALVTDSIAQSYELRGYTFHAGVSVFWSTAGVSSKAFTRP